MAQFLRVLWPLLACGAALLAGCRSRPEFLAHDEPDYYQTYATQIDYPNEGVPVDSDALRTPAPHTVRRGGPAQAQPLSLEEAVKIVLARVEVRSDPNRVTSNAHRDMGI